MKNKKYISIALLFCLLLIIYYFISIDNQKVVREYILLGESENWIAEYKIQKIKRKNQQPEIVKKATLRIAYKKNIEDIENIDTLTYSLKDGHESRKTIEKFSSITPIKNLEFQEISYSSINNDNIEINYTNNSIVELEIAVNGSKEKLLLKLIE